MKMTSWLCCVLVAALATIFSAVAVRAQPAVPEIRAVTMTISPMAAPDPALRYHLLPELRDTTPGNAALLYYRSFAPDWRSPAQRGPAVSEALDRAMKMPLAELRQMERDPNNKIGFVREAGFLKEIDRAARRQYCDWDLVTRAREDGMGMLIPDIQSFRAFAPMLAVRARFALADGKFSEAERNLQTGLKFARDVSNGPTLIQSLVGVAIATTMLDQVEEWVRTPDSPNLYWALSELPEPFIDLRKPYQGERLIIDNLLPGYREALAKHTMAPMSEADLQNKQHNFALLGSGTAPTTLITFLVLKKYGPAKEYLLSHEWSADTVEALPALQAVLLYEIAMYDHWYDEFIKWNGLPYARARAGFEQTEREFKKWLGESGSPGLSLAGLLLPATFKVSQASARLDRRIAALRCVEAIRIYASAHHRLPAALSDIAEVFVPADPATGTGFDYRVDGDSATLTAAAPLPPTGFKYEISLRSHSGERR